MRLEALDEYFRSLFDIDGFAGADRSLNGLQVGRPGMEVSKAAFAVDGVKATFARARERGAQLLFVHHGLWWGSPYPLTGPTWGRFAELFAGDLALYAVHLPLDAHPDLGNNRGIAEAIQLSDLQPFGRYRGKVIGTRGSLPEPRSAEWLASRIVSPGETALSILPFGPPEITSVAVISGGAPMEVEEAAAAGVDCFITGDALHTSYHLAREAGITLISAGHYATEVYGVQRTASRLAAETGLETEFIDVPTGL